MKNTFKFWMGCVVEAAWWLFYCFAFTIAMSLYALVMWTFHVKLVNANAGLFLYTIGMTSLLLLLSYVLIPWDMLFPVELSPEDKAKFDRL